MITAQKNEKTHTFAENLKRQKYNLTVSSRLKEARKRKKLTVTKAYRQLKDQGYSIGHSSLMAYESDEKMSYHRYPSHTVLLALSEFYDCSLDYLYGISDDFTRPTNDLAKLLTYDKPFEWNGKLIDNAQKEMLIYKMNQIMEL